MSYSEKRKLSAKNSIHLLFRIFLVLAAVSAGRFVYGQTFQYNSTGDAPALIGFRVPSSPNNFELVANLGNVITNFENLPIGTTVVLTNRLMPSQLTNAYPAGFDNIQWSVSAAFSGLSYNGLPGGTVWLTVPRADPNSQTTPPQRFGQGGQSQIRGNMTAVGNGAKNVSGTLSSNINNTVYTVREPNPTSTTDNYSYWVGAVFDPNSNPSLGTFDLPHVVENTMPSPFTSAILSDFYRARA